MMMDSGARGNISNFSQLAGMRGLMAANGRIMGVPILSNFRGLSAFWKCSFSTHGARKGMTDTAYKTADSGYPFPVVWLIAAQDVIIREDDRGTDRGLLIRAITDGKEATETI